MSVVIALLGRAGWLDAGVRELCDPSDRLTGWIPACGDLCIIPFLPQQGEVPKAEGVLLRQALSGTHAGRTPSVAPRQLPLRGGANESKASGNRGYDELLGAGLTSCSSACSLYFVMKWIQARRIWLK